jgi:hypothetical protein
MTRYQSWILTDASHDLWLDTFAADHNSLALQTSHTWSIRKRTMRGGLREGIDAIDLDNGELNVTILPTRGMGLWRGSYHGLFLGWQAPFLGPVHPRHVNLEERGGLGWLTGFDELLCRCGLASNGPPGEDVHTDQAGRTHRDLLTLHGRIANRPAHYVEVRVNLDPPHDLSVIGRVEEGGLFYPHLHLTTTYTTVPGSHRLVIHDLVENRGGSATEMQLLYHLNVGQPFLEAGSRVLLPLHEMAPRDSRAAEGVATWDTYAGPMPGFAEQCYYCDLAADSYGHTLAMLQNNNADKALAVRLNRNELPCFTIWRNTAAAADGYVTGFEPGTNFPNIRSFERHQGRVRLLPPGGCWECKWSLEVHDAASAVATVQKEMATIQAHAPTIMHATPHERFSPR